MKEFRNMVIAGVLVDDRVSNGSIGLVRGRSRLKYMLDNNDYHRALKGISELGRILFAAGAVKIGLPFLGAPYINSENELHGFMSAMARKKTIKLHSVHAMGSCAMGIDGRTSVVDGTGHLYGVDNLVISDASVIPTSLGVNPQETIMALATKFAEDLSK